jgi:hypothetical protein
MMLAMLGGIALVLAGRALAGAPPLAARRHARAAAQLRGKPRGVRARLTRR